MSEWIVPGYTELKELGSGGFGAVVLARHDATGTAVAIKYLLPGLRQDPDFAAMFRAEAEALGALDDPHVVRLYEYVESPSGAAIVMELVDGVTLWDILSRHGKTTPEAALAVTCTDAVHCPSPFPPKLPFLAPRPALALSHVTSLEDRSPGLDMTSGNR